MLSCFHWCVRACVCSKTALDHPWFSAVAQLPEVAVTSGMKNNLHSFIGGCLRTAAAHYAV